VILLLAESPTLTVISAVVTAASGAGTIGLVLRLVVASEQFEATDRVGPDPLGIRAR
jgi:hypothetical protein